ncbi:hypothetical protein D5086_029951 [Populus alba]|uniref:Uncharacterized protein n=1 Tax=Populus alba TaxID=43335 RepID=A0ACC4AM84_POPAL
MLEGVQRFHPITPEEAVKLMCLEKKRPPFKIKEVVPKPRMVHTVDLENDCICKFDIDQNLLSDQPFLRSSQDWIKFVATVQNKDGGKTLLSFHGMDLLP